jgi:hypothetical protein
MKMLAMPPVLALAAGVLAMSATTALAAGSPASVAGAPPAHAGRTPPGYRIVESSTFTAHNGVQTRGTVLCPAGTVAWGGGVIFNAQHLGMTINSSFPMSRGAGWVGDVNDVGSSDGEFVIQAVCAQAPRRYRIVESPAITADPGTVASGSQSCPGRTALLGGGSLSSSTSVAVFVNSTFPEAPVNGWVARQSDNTSVASTFNVLAICGKAPRGYTVAAGPVVAVPAFTEVAASVVCPAGHPLSGGATSPSSAPAVALTTTAGDHGGWTVFEDNSALIQNVTVFAIVICA